MEAKALEMLSKMILTPENIGIMVSAWFLIALSRRVFKEFFKRLIMQRILPLLPMLLCMGLVWLPGLSPKGTTWGWNIILGIVLGWGVGHLHKILSRTVFGKSIFINGDSEESDDPKKC